MGEASFNSPPYISVQEYLDVESLTDVRHTYFAGTVTAMAGASADHGEVAMNLATDLHSHLDGKPCRVYKGDLKLRLKVNTEDTFLYPDIMVACDPTDKERYYRERPKVLVEVLSEDVNQDLMVKFLMYKTIPSVEDYIVLSQDPTAPRAYIHRREQNWEQEVVELDGTLEIPSLGFSVPLKRLYRGLLTAI